VSQSFEMNVFPKSTAGKMEPFWNARLRLRCDACRYSVVQKWREHVDWREPADVTVATGAILEMTRGLTAITEPDVKRTRKA
jgi:hypothetical protein